MVIHNDNQIKGRVVQFLNDLRFRYRIAKKARQELDKYLASDFNLVDIIKPGENDISLLISTLLNPEGPHGQGDMFLRKFLEILDQNLPHNEIEKLLNESYNLEYSVVNTEISTDDNRRIDILIRIPNGLVIGIENKITAGDQRNQLRDYNNYLNKISQQNYVLIYLTCSGRKPSKESISTSERNELEKQGRFMAISYRKLLIPWLRESLKECEADKVRWFVKDFISWIEENCQEVKEDEKKQDF